MSTLSNVSTKAAWSQLWHRSNAKPMHQCAGKGVENVLPPATPPLDAAVWTLVILQVWEGANQTEVLTPCTKFSWL